MTIPHFTEGNREFDWKEEEAGKIVEMLFKDGTHYEGTVYNGLPDGLGIATQLDGTVYEGQWRAGLREGFGTETQTTNETYIG